MECHMEFKPALHIVSLVLSALIISANSIIIYLFLRNRHLRKNVTNLLIVSLCLADLVNGISVIFLVLPFYYINFNDCSTTLQAFEPAYFAATDILTNGLTIVCVLHLLLLSCEHFVSLYYALRYRAIVTRNRIFALCIIAWLVGLSVSFIQFSWLLPFIKDPSTSLLLEVRKKENIYTVTSVVLFAFIPIFFLTTKYAWLFCLFQRLLRREANLLSKKQRNRDLKMILFYSVMFVSFILFCCPYLLLKVLISFNNPSIKKLPAEFYEGLFVLRYILSLINPLIYAVYKRDFKKVIKNRFKLPKIFFRKRIFESADNNLLTEHENIIRQDSLAEKTIELSVLPK